MRSRAAVAGEAGKPLVIEEVEVAGPKKGEVVLRIFLSSSRQNSISNYEPEHC